MKRYNSGEVVPFGVYISLRALSVKYIDQNNDILRGSQNASYFRVPNLLLFFTAPFVGGAFVVAFPLLIAICCIAIPVYYLVRPSVGSVSEKIVSSSALKWQPTAAYLKGKKQDENKKQHKVDKTVPAELKDLEDKVRRKREEE